MKFGMWGPRFAQTERPDGDWFIVPSLWTGGFDVDHKTGLALNNSAQVAEVSEDRSTIDEEVWPRWKGIIFSHGLAYVLSFIAMHLLVLSVQYARTADMLARGAGARVPKLILGRTSAFLVPVEWKLNVFKMIGALFLGTPAGLLIQRAKRKWL